MVLSLNYQFVLFSEFLVYRTHKFIDRVCPEGLHKCFIPVQSRSRTASLLDCQLKSLAQVWMVFSESLSQGAFQFRPTKCPLLYSVFKVDSRIDDIVARLHDIRERVTSIPRSNLISYFLD